MLVLKRLCVSQKACVLRGTAAFARQATETAAATGQADERSRFNRGDVRFIQENGSNSYSQRWNRVC